MKKLLVVSLSIFLFSSCKSNINEPNTQVDEQFVQIHFKYSFLDELNTFEGTLQKDLIMDGVIKIDFWLTFDEQTKIINKAYEISFFELPDNFPRDSSMIIMPDPGKQFIRIKYKSEDKTISWFSFPDEEDNIELNTIKNFALFIKDLIHNKPEYKKLPTSRGFRL